MKLIGTGAFTKAYLRSDGKVQLESCCPIKECMSMGWFPNSRLFPKVKRIDYQVYEMKYYPPVNFLKSSLNTDHWIMYCVLSELHSNNFYYEREASCSRAEHWYNMFKTLKNRRFRTALCEAMEACRNYDDNIGFEVVPRNTAVHNGNLILLDYFYSVTTLDEIIKR